MTISAI
jgi:hypothetical protein